MTKREKEKYLEKRQRSWLWPSRREMGRLKARREAPAGENGEILWEKTSAPTIRRRDIGKMSALKEKKEKERVTVVATKSKEACNLETNTAWGDESD
jgi:hypothetical protein